MSCGVLNSWRFAGPEKNMDREEVKEWLCVGRSFIIPHDEYSIIRYSLVICMVCVTICTWCFHFKYIWRNCFRSQPQMRSCWNMLLGGTLEPVCSWELHLRAASVVVVFWGFWPERWITFLQVVMSGTYTCRSTISTLTEHYCFNREK